MDPRFRQFLINSLVRDVKYNQMKMCIEIGAISLQGRRSRHAVYEEGKLYQYEPETIDGFIQQIVETGVNLDPTRQEVSSFDPISAKIGQHLLIVHETNGNQNNEEILKTDLDNFLLIDHDRGALETGSFLQVKSTPWSIGSPILLKAGTNTGLYEMGNVVKIVLFSPPEIYQYIDPAKPPTLKRRLFASHPDLKGEDGFSYDVLSTKQDEDSLFIIEQNQNRAVFHPIQGIAYSAKAVEEAISPTCEILNSFSSERVNLKIIRNGELALTENRWIVTSKPEIEFN